MAARSILTRSAVIPILWLSIVIAAAAASNKPDTSKMLSAIAKLVAVDGRFPHEFATRVTAAAGGAEKVMLANEPRTVLPVRIRFQGVRNSYCRVAVSGTAERPVALIPLPDSADHVQCFGMEKVAVTDLNGDGIPDFVFRLSVLWNRGNVIVPESAVYLSNAAQHNYCYSPGASRAVTSGIMPQSEHVRAAVQSEVTRLGPQVLDCYRGE